jgi:hypothetical protein
VASGAVGSIGPAALGVGDARPQPNRRSPASDPEEGSEEEEEPTMSKRGRLAGVRLGAGVGDGVRAAARRRGRWRWSGAAGGDGWAGRPRLWRRQSVVRGRACGGPRLGLAALAHAGARRWPSCRHMNLYRLM